MIKINKGCSNADIPKSLRQPTLIQVQNGKITLTQKRRLALIRNGMYIYKGIYDSRYKLNDIRKALEKVYNSDNNGRPKCAFCEQKIEQYHIEHYRPKLIYYWLAFSWDNLILACPKCNEYKGANFPIATGTISVLIPGADVNIQSHLHDISEQPFVVNPEVTDPYGFIYFNKDGSIDSDDPRFYYTIKICQIDRKGLNDDRKTILDNFRKNLNAEKRVGAF